MSVFVLLNPVCYQSCALSSRAFSVPRQSQKNAELNLIRKSTINPAKPRVLPPTFTPYKSNKNDLQPILRYIDRELLNTHFPEIHLSHKQQSAELWWISQGLRICFFPRLSDAPSSLPEESHFKTHEYIPYLNLRKSLHITCYTLYFYFQI